MSIDEVKSFLEKEDSVDFLEDEIARLDLSPIGKFPLLNEPCGKDKYDIYQSEGKFPDDFCGGVGHNVAPVYNHNNLVVSECKCAETIKDALNLLYRLQRSLKQIGIGEYEDD